MTTQEALEYLGERAKERPSGAIYFPTYVTKKFCKEFLNLSDSDIEFMSFREKTLLKSEMISFALKSWGERETTKSSEEILRTLFT